MVQIGLAEVKAKLSSLIRRVEAGEEILITLHDRPVAALVPASRYAKHEGTAEGRYSTPAPESPAVVREFSGATYSPLGKVDRTTGDSGVRANRLDGSLEESRDLGRDLSRDLGRDLGGDDSRGGRGDFTSEPRRSGDPEMIEKTTHFLLTLKPEERISLLEDALAALAEREAAHNLIAMMGSDPDVIDIPRRR